MANAGYRIYQNFKRPGTELLSLFEGIPVPNLDDCMNRTASLGGGIHSLNGKRLTGPAYTITCPEGDNLLFYYAIANAQPGDVIVVANNGFSGRALCGEIMATWAKARQLGGFVIDGAIRDFEELSHMDFPVFAVHSNPNGPYKNGVGEINVPVNVGGKVIYPGDILVGDGDGIIAIHPKDAEQIAAAAHQVMKKEAAMMESIHRTGELDIAWVYKKLEDSHCEMIEEMHHGYSI